MFKTSLNTRSAWLFFLFFITCKPLLAHNGNIGYAYPLNNITIDGSFTDWPANISTYQLGFPGPVKKMPGQADLNSSFRIGYIAGTQSVYIALQVTDDDFVDDTSAHAAWNTQDAMELYLDARHLPTGSGVASFYYGKKLRHTNNAYYDAFAKDAKWNITEIAFVQKGNTRYYEWRINLGDQFVVGKTIGMDFQVFDLDSDKSFSVATWGSGDSKYVNPRSLSDVMLMPANEKLATITGNITWDKKIKTPLPTRVRLIPSQHRERWFTALADSLGHYSANIPAGKYAVDLPDAYLHQGDTIYATAQKKPIVVTAVAGGKATVPLIVIPATPVPDLLPEKGILMGDFTQQTAQRIDDFIKAHQQYEEIPGASLAIIKDGKLAYYKTYGVRNTFTRQPVDSNTLFEAASITKPVFAFAVQRLAERGIINLDTPLYRYLPYDDIAYDERYKLITGKHVLTHQTGFPNWRYMNSDGKLDIKFTPGTKFGYSGEGFEYLKMVVEKITGKKVEQVLQEEVIEPIGLYHTFFSRNDSLQQMAANGHFNMLPSYDELPETPGMAYSMHTEAKIFTRFMLYLLEQKGLNANTYHAMLSKQTEYNIEPGDKKPPYPTYMGMSLEVCETPFGKSFGHGGNNGDFKCTFRVYKDLKMGYVLFTNSNTSDVLLESLAQFLVEGKNK